MDPALRSTRPPPPPPPHPPRPPRQPPRPPRPYLPLWRVLREDEWPRLAELVPGRRPGSVRPFVIVLLVPCMWWLTAALVLFYTVARSARRVARGSFPRHPQGRIEDGAVLKVQRARAWAAVAASGGLVAVYGGVSEAWDQFVQRLYLAPWLALASAILVAAILFAAARRQRRLLMRAHFKNAGLTVLKYVGAWLLVPALFIGSLMAMTVLPSTVTENSLIFLYVAALAIWTPFWWVVYFLCFASGPAVRNAFSLSALHPALPPLTTSVAVWVFALVSQATGGPPPFPQPLADCAVLTGPATVTVVAVWEMYRLRQRHGVRWRG